MKTTIDNMEIELQKGEKISKVKNRVTGDIYYSSNLYEKFINGDSYIAVFSKPDGDFRRKMNWMKKDHLHKVLK